jgi:ribose transport system substrate-binding protein
VLTASAEVRLAAIDDHVGRELAGYRIRSLLGRGGMGVVYCADHVALGRTVALKLLASEFAEDERFRMRFLSESRLAASIEHPHIVPIYDAGEADGLLYIAMRYIQGVDLRTLVRREGGLEGGRTLAIVSQVADALDAAHARGLVHRDVKSRNVLICEEDGADHCYLSDFGLVKTASSESSLTAGGQLLGTIEYVAPEQIEGKPVDPRADVYSLGCVLYECLTGEVPFVRESELAVIYAQLVEEPPAVTSRCPTLPRAFDFVVATALAKSREARYASCGELAAAARAAAGGTVRRPAGRRHVLRRPRKSVAALATAATLAAAASAGILLTGGGSQSRDASGRRSASASFVGAAPGSGKGLKIGYISLGEKLPFVRAVSNSIREQARIAGANLVFCDAALDPAKAVACAQGFRRQRVDGYLDFNSFEKDSPRVCAAGPAVPVLAIDIHQDPCERAFMGADNAYAGYIAGRAIGAYVKRAFDCKYDAFVSLEIPAPGIVTNERMGGYRRGFSSACGTINHFRKLDFGVRDPVARSRIAAVLRSLPGRHRIIVVGINDGVIQLALDEAKRLGRKDDLYVSGQGADHGAWCEIEYNSHWVAESAYFPERYGEIAIPNLIRLIRHQDVPQLLYVPHVVLNGTNIQSYYRPSGCRA